MICRQTMRVFISSCVILVSSGIDVVRTPHGLRPRMCVHSVPSGTLVESLPQGMRHRFPNGTERTFGPCLEAAQLRTLPPNSTSNAVAHYPAPLYSTPSSSAPVSKFTAKITIPKAPTEQADQSIYIWIGTDPDDESDVMQPVVGWNRVGGTDPSGSWYGVGGWGIESWMMVPSGHSTFSDTVWGFQPGDVIDNLIQADSSIGSNGYYISASGTINGKPVETVLRALGRKSEHLPAVQFETWNEYVNGQVACARMPASDVLFSELTVEPAASFFSTAGINWDLSTSCAWQKTLTQPSSGAASWLLSNGGQYPWNLCGNLPADLATPCAAWSDSSCSAQACDSWAQAGDCTTNPTYMLKMCMPQCCKVGPGKDPLTVV